MDLSSITIALRLYHKMFMLMSLSSETPFFVISSVIVPKTNEHNEMDLNNDVYKSKVDSLRFYLQSKIKLKYYNCSKVHLDI